MACRVELCSSSGKELREFSLDECHGAPHEFRGVARGELLATLRSAVPPDTIRYDTAVKSIHTQEEGMYIQAFTLDKAWGCKAACLTPCLCKG